VTAARSGATGEHGLSPREVEVLGLIREHLTNVEIAARLYISNRTVESHVSALLRKLGAAHRRELARIGAPAVDLDEQPPSMPPALALLADEATFVGRTGERDALRRYWELVCGGHTLVVLVMAEAGMGKSRLVSEFARDVHADGGKVLLGTCHEDVDDPYGAFLEAIAEDASGLDRAELRRRAGDMAETLAGLAPELARILGTSPGPRPSTDADDSARSMVLDAIRQWFVDSASATPSLLILEDLHWSTSTTKDVLRLLARRANRAPLLVVVTTRASKPDLDADLAALIADLERSPVVRRIRLHGLDREEVGQLVGGATPDEAEELRAETGGNPLLVTHMGSDPGQRSLPGWLVRRDALLDDESRAVLDMAATLGAEFDVDRLAAAHGAPLLEVLESLETAEAAGLVAPHPSRVGRFTFAHALFRSHRYASLPLRRRLELHGRAAAALATSPDDDRVRSERARHACLALPLGDAREAVELVRSAARQAELAYAYDEAVAQYRRGLDAARYLDPPDPAVTLDFTVRIAAALHHRGDPAGLPMLLDAARQARQDGNTDALVRAATAIPQFGAVGFVDSMPEGRAATEAALAALGPEPSPARARLMMDLASHSLFLSVEEALRIARRAESIARDLGDPEVLGAVLLAARHLLSHPSHIDDRVRIGQELISLGNQLGRLSMTLGGMHAVGAAHLERGDLDDWRAAFERFTSLLGDHSLGFFQIQTIMHRAHRAYLAGELASAEAIAAGTVPLSQGIGAGRVFAESAVAACRRLQARDDELVARFERGARRSSDAWYRCSLAASYARNGQLDPARATLRQLRVEGFAIRKIYPWSVAVSDVAEAAEITGDAKAAEHVLRVAEPYSGRIAVSGPHPGRPFDQVLAQAALGVGEPAAAAAYAERAVEASRERSTPVFLVRELVFLAEARRRQGATTADTRDLVREASAIAERIGARVALVDIERYRLLG
jgi:DNA-binding CsgD family transcriptional regulator/predicted secreted protein